MIKLLKPQMYVLLQFCNREQCTYSHAESLSPVGTRQCCILENRRSLVQSPAHPKFFLRIDDSYCDRIHSSLTAVCCFDNGYVGKQPVAWKEYCVVYWLSMDRCTGRRNITELLNAIQQQQHSHTYDFCKNLWV